jgi:hypothetical protein
MMQCVVCSNWWANFRDSQEQGKISKSHVQFEMPSKQFNVPNKLLSVTHPRSKLWSVEYLRNGSI